MARWQLQDAKARFSEVVKMARTQGPQEITVHGKLAAVILSKDDFEKLSKPKPNFVEFIRNSPLMGLDIDLTREDSASRDIDL